MGNSMFKSGHVYRHLTSKDLDILIVKVRFSDDKRSKLLIKWVNKHTGNVVVIPGKRYDGTDNIEIKKKDFQYWKIV